MDRISVESLFNNLKNGDMVGFHYEKWYYIIGKIINFFSYKVDSKNLIEIEHIGQAYNVFKNENILTFTFGESIGHEGGKISTEFSIIKNKNNYMIDSRFRNKSIESIYIPCIAELTQGENEKCNEFWALNQKGYNEIYAAVSVNWFQKIFSKFSKFYKNKTAKDFDNFCSGSVNAFFYEIGFTDNDIAPSPAEIVNQNYIDKKNIKKIV